MYSLIVTPDDDLRAAVDLDVVDDVLVAVGQELGERVLGLVEVVVGIEDREVEHRRRHGDPPSLADENDLVL